MHASQNFPADTLSHHEKELFGRASICRLAQNLVDDQVDVVLSWLHRHNDMRVPMSAPITHGPGAYLVLNSCEGQCIAKVYL